MDMNDSMDVYEKLADEHIAAPASAPVAQFSGEQTAGIMASFMEPDAEAHHEEYRLQRA